MRFMSEHVTKSIDTYHRNFDKSNRMGATSETLPEPLTSPWILSFFFWSLFCLFFFDLRILITPLVSSNSSCNHFSMYVETG
jgi:hypothetical protein